MDNPDSASPRPDSEPKARFGEPKDCPHVLPLQVIPLKTKALRAATLTKNGHLESVVELFAGAETGSGQVPPDQLGEFFDFNGERQSDLEMVQALGELPSYDVYSLRRELRELGIDVADGEELRLSRGMEAKLSAYMQSFTRPLIAAIYGEHQTNGQSLEDVVRLLHDPDVETAQDNLRALASRLEIGVLAIPDFLSRYGDLYLSLAYYDFCLDQIRPALAELRLALAEIRLDHKNRPDRTLVEACDLIEDRLSGAEASTSRILQIFRIETETMWKKVSPSRFRVMDDMIEGYQMEIGGSVCALTAKMNSWERYLGQPGGQSREAFVLSDMLQGIDRVPRGYLSAGPFEQAPSAD